MTDDRLEPCLALTLDELARVRRIARRDGASVLAAALAAALVDVEGSDALVDRMLGGEAH
jgi:hypothetical protein